MKRTICMAVLLAVVAAVSMGTEAASGRPASPGQQYSITDLGTLPGDTRSSANAINDRGQVVGNSLLIVFREPTYFFVDFALLWENGKMTDLGTLPGGDSSFASAINNRGQIVGTSTNTDSHESHAFLWERGKMTDLGTLPHGDFSYASAINNRGQIVGGSRTDSGEFHAVLWTK